MEYVYSNPEYVSKVNDFGDDYHKPESEYDAYDKEVLRKLRSMKRTYRDPNEFCEIKTLYIQYTKDLIAKYGGKKRFKKLYALGFIKDYIPFCPVLRRIKKNKYFYKDGEKMKFVDKLIDTFKLDRKKFLGSSFSNNCLDFLVKETREIDYCDLYNLLFLSDQQKWKEVNNILKKYRR